MKNHLTFLCLLTTFACFAQKRLNLTLPDDALTATRKVQASLVDGESCIYYWEGSVYSRIPQERDKLLFNYVGMNIRTTKTDTAHGKTGYRQYSREILLYMNPKTGEVIRTWTNPWTQKEVTVLQIVNDPVNSRGVLTADDLGTPFSVVDGRAFWNIEVPLLYPNPMKGETYKTYVGTNKPMYQAIEMFNFSVDVKELTNPKKKRADDVNISWARVCQWLPWMEMGDKEGWLIYNGQGKKLSKFDHLPTALKDFIAKEHPEFTTPPPIDDKRPNETSWTYFKKWIDKKRGQ
ncbi:MAG: DUF1838 family protein [Saprospiraceae bacterium]|nr:DUF1838 family protein [Saprospiraceae bacterium]